MRPSPADQYYQRGPTHCFRMVWRRKWIGLVLLTSLFTIFLVTMRHQSLGKGKPIERDTYMDDVSDDLYQQVIREWYNFTDDEKWYNGRELSPSNNVDWDLYLTDIRQNFVFSKHNANESYRLDKPELRDPSMGQAEAIRGIFGDKKNGFFVECGAYDGETRSNTLYFERFMGWTGLLIEADPINFSKMLQKNRNALLSPTCLSIQPRPVLASFLMARNIGRLHEPHNNTEDDQRNSPDIAHVGKHIRVQCFPFAHYLAALEIKTVDYFSLDIEGNEIDVLATIPFEEVDIRTLSVEYVHNAKGRKYLIDMMEARGYYVYSFVEHLDNLANDVIFVKRGIR